MKFWLLLFVGLMLVFLGSTGRTGDFLMAVFYPSNMTVSP